MAARPWLVLVTGEPGSGKTSLGLQLSHALRVPFLSRDQVRGGLMATAGMWTDQVEAFPPRELAVDALVQLVETAATAGISMVVEFVVLPDRVEAFKRIEAATSCVVVRTECTDAAERARERDLADPLLNRPDVLAALGYASVDAYLRGTAEHGDRVRKEMQADFDLPLMRVRTDDGYDPPLEATVAWIVDQTRR